MNPILPLSEYVPDVEARVFSDGCVYLYGSMDTAGDLTYCSRQYHAYRSRNGMRTWEKGPVAFSTVGGHFLYAPDCVECNGQYYLYYCLSDGSEGVAVSADPLGPFADLGLIEGVGNDGIDPAALVDDDGSVYYFWGQFQLRGARMKEDMRSIDPLTMNREILSEEVHGFHEGASIRKRNGLYYLLYTDISRGRATCISYAISDKPLGPYKKGGVIVDNTGCDPETWNNHGSMEQIGGQWYVFYHRSSHHSVFSRRVCCEPIHFDSDGKIQEVPMSTSGWLPSVPPGTVISMANACRLMGDIHIAATYTPDGIADVLRGIRNGDTVAFRGLGAMGAGTFRVCAASAMHEAVIEVRMDGADGPLLCSVPVQPTGGWHLFQSFEAAIPALTAPASTIVLVFKGGPGRLLEVRDMTFLPEATE